MDHREFKDQMYAQFARIGSTLGSEKRLELLDLLAQAPRSVDALAKESAMSVANTSRHLQALKAARLVDAVRSGTRVIYRLADPSVLTLWLALRSTAEARLAEVSQIPRDSPVEGAPDEELTRQEMQGAIATDDVLLVDVRPSIEFDHGHLPGAVSIPVDTLPDATPTLPTDRRIVVYCRGRYYRFADEAVAILRTAGFDAVRLEGGWPEWLAEGRPVSS